MRIPCSLVRQACCPAFACKWPVSRVLFIYGSLSSVVPNDFFLRHFFQLVLSKSARKCRGVKEMRNTITSTAMMNVLVERVDVASVTAVDNVCTHRPLRRRLYAKCGSRGSAACHAGQRRHMLPQLPSASLNQPSLSGWLGARSWRSSGRRFSSLAFAEIG